MHFPRQLHAQPYRRKPWWQMRLRLGRYRSGMSDRGLLPASGDEEPLVPRDRHHVQTQDPGPPVEEDCHRRQRRRVGYVITVWEGWIMAVLKELLFTQELTKLMDSLLSLLQK